MSYFSIVIPIYNKENFIENTIKSVLNQSFTDFELLLINDGSTDQSEAIIAQFQDLRIQYYKKENEGVSCARNFGIAKASSKYIAFLDADDYWYSNFLMEIYNNTLQFPKEKIFATAIEIESKKTIFPAQYSIKKTGNTALVNYFKASSKQSVLSSSSCVIATAVFEKIGTFDTAIKIGEDTDFWIRIGLNYAILFSWKILSRYVYDSKSLSNQKLFLDTNLNFSKFELVEKTNPELNYFLDLNRFSLAIKSKIAGDISNYKRLYDLINKNNLSLKKQFLLMLPSFMLKKSIDFKYFLASNGLGNAVFK